MDIRLKVYFIFTTINTLCDITSQIDEQLYIILIALFRLFTMYLLIVYYNNGTKRLQNNIKYMMILSYTTSVLYWLYKAPCTWEANQWSVHTDIVMILYLLQFTTTTEMDDNNDNADAIATTTTNICVQTIQEMFCCYYCAAGFFKYNTHFLNPIGSCATMFMTQHITYYLSPPILSIETLQYIVQSIKPYAPIGTIIVEMLMGLSITFGRILQSRLITCIGLLIILYFHLIICITPEPNDISNFGLITGSRLMILLEPNSIHTVVRVYIQPYYMYILLIIIPVVVSYGIQTNYTPLNWAFLLFMPILVVSQLAVYIESTQPKTSTTTNITNKTNTIRRPFWTKVATAFAAFYAFGSLILGLQEEATPNMFSNLKVHGGSNHLFVPTGLLFHLFANAPDSHVYGGGVIRIESTTSNWLQTIYPAELTHVLEPTNIIVPLLSSIGNPPPIYFNPGANRVLGLLERGWVQHSGNYYNYTVPGIEFKRLLREAIKKDSSFTLTFAQLPGTKGDEIWRAFAVRRRYVLSVENGQISKCMVTTYNNDDAETVTDKCNPHSDIPYHLHVPWIIQKFAMYHPYPIVFDENGLPRQTITCFGP